MIDNTARNMKDPLRMLGFLAAAMGPDGVSRAIKEQERAGQAQLVHSDRLPVDTDGTDFLAVGFTFGEPDPSDPLFRPATLPEGWKREPSDHDMWSFILDPLGRRRVRIFYKASFYDRRAHMSLISVPDYVRGCVFYDRPVITDGEWATPAAVRDAALAEAADAHKNIDLWAARNDPDCVAMYTAARDKYAAIAAEQEGTAQ